MSNLIFYIKIDFNIHINYYYHFYVSTKIIIFFSETLTLGLIMNLGISIRYPKTNNYSS